MAAGAVFAGSPLRLKPLELEDMPAVFTAQRLTDLPRFEAEGLVEHRRGSPRA